MDYLKISASRLATFRRSPRLWFWQYVLNLPQTDSPAKQGGTDCHSMIEKVHKGELLPCPIPESCNIVIPWLNSPEFKTEFAGGISEFIFKFHEDNIRFSGKIDYFRVDGPEALVVEFKFTKSHTWDKTELAHRQLMFYAWIILKLYPVQLEQFKLRTVFFSRTRKKNPKIEDTIVTKEQVLSYYERNTIPLILQMHEIQNTGKLPPCNGHCCNFCPQLRTEYHPLCNGICPKEYKKTFLMSKRMLGRNPTTDELHRCIYTKEVRKYIKFAIEYLTKYDLNDIIKSAVQIDQAINQEKRKMSKENEKYLTSPVVEALFSHIRHEDLKFGGYSLTLKLDPTNSDHLQFIDEIKAFETSVLKDPKDEPLKFREDLSKEKEVTGKILLKAKSKYPPKTFDRSAKLVQTTEELPMGSKVKLTIKLATYKTNSKHTGVTAYLQGVQILNAAEFNNGFKEEKSVDLDSDTLD